MEVREEENARVREGEKETICMRVVRENWAREEREKKGRDRSLERKRGLGLFLFLYHHSVGFHTNERKTNVYQHTLLQLFTRASSLLLSFCF